MTTTTKIFVILVSLFAFIFTPMAVQFAARTYRWRDLAENYQKAQNAAEASERNAKAVAASDTEQHRRLLDQDQRRLLDARQQLADLQRRTDALTKERDDVARSRDMLETQAGVLTAEMAVRSRHESELAKGKEDALGEQRKLQTANTWLTDQLQLRNAENEVLKQQLNQRSAELTTFREENEQLRKSLNLGRAGELTAAPSANVQPATPPIRSPIEGKITQIRDGLASIDVGSASGVREGMTMVITRNNYKEYVGDLKITRDVSPRESVGRVMPASDKQIRVGDVVQDEASFTKR